MKKASTVESPTQLCCQAGTARLRPGSRTACLVASGAREMGEKWGTGLRVSLRRGPMILREVDTIGRDELLQHALLFSRRIASWAH